MTTTVASAGKRAVFRPGNVCDQTHNLCKLHSVATAHNGSFRGHPAHLAAAAAANHHTIRPSHSSRRVVLARASGPTGKGYPPGVEDIGVNLLKAPKMLLTAAERVRLDEAPDSQFYSTPRLMQHAEPEFIAALTGLYSSTLPPGAHVLELCSSRHSHMPEGLQLGQLVGQGMNAQELAANPALTHCFVQDLNQQPLLLEQVASSYDAVLCVNGLQYLTQPELVIAEAFRVLRPGGYMLIAFGPHCFPEKAIAGWLSRSMQERCTLVTRMLQANGFDQVLVRDSIAEPEAASSSSSNAAEQLRILVATKPSIPLPTSAGASRCAADNVAEWFTKPGLAGLIEPSGDVAFGAAAGDSGDVAGGLLASAASNERVIEQWVASYEVMMSDAEAMGIPRSVIPVLARDASPAEIKAAVEHLQNMVASFLSAGL